MDTAIYLVTALITVVWAVWTYLLWADRAGLPEESGLRFLMIVGPTVFFIITALAGWEKTLYLRLDIIGILALDAVTLVSLAFLIVVYYILHRRSSGGYRLALIFYFIAGAFIAALSHLLKYSPSMLLLLYGWVNELAEMEFFKFAWVGLDTGAAESDLVGMLNRIVIAVFSYIPIAMVRFVYNNHQRKRFEQQIEELRGRLEELERRGG